MASRIIPTIAPFAKSFILITPNGTFQNASQHHRESPKHPAHQPDIEHLRNYYGYEYGAGGFFSDTHNLPHNEHGQKNQHPYNHDHHSGRLHPERILDCLELVM